ncbi:MAG: flavin reductase family protein [Oscillospiraceae bacterium]|jgi:flavin reductase (DIM6/NTAB) family NADH-FMN oxidoreductase RutF|nr:flavin reductase family protein [Oscillospiraceae bacterium]
MKKSIPPHALLYPNPVLVVCTYDANGKANAATLAWGGIASSEPPAISIALQKPRYTYDALTSRKAFTVNLVPAKYAAEADYFGIASGRDADKFAVTGLTPVKSAVVDAPYIAEFPYALECEVIHALDLGRHTLFIGEVKGTVVEDGTEALWGGDIISWNAATREYFAQGTAVANAFEAGLRFVK